MCTSKYCHIPSTDITLICISKYYDILHLRSIPPSTISSCISRGHISLYHLILSHLASPGVTSPYTSKYYVIFYFQMLHHSVLQNFMSFGIFRHYITLCLH